MDKAYSGDLFKRKMEERLKEIYKCPYCGFERLLFQDEISMLQVQNSMKGVQFGKVLPCGVVVCPHCGYVHLFALSAYGFRP